MGAQLGTLFLLPNPTRNCSEVALLKHARSEVLRVLSNMEEGTREIWKKRQKKQREDAGYF